MSRLCLPGAVLAAALGTWGCQEAAGLDLSGGFHDLMRHGIHFSYSVPMEKVLPVRAVMPFNKMGPPLW